MEVSLIPAVDSAPRDGARVANSWLELWLDPGPKPPLPLAPRWSAGMLGDAGALKDKAADDADTAESGGDTRASVPGTTIDPAAPA